MGYRGQSETGRTSMWNVGNPLMMLIILNIVFFILLNFIKSIYVFSSMQEEAFYRNVYHWFVIPAEPIKLITRPWTILTMAFSEVKLILVISNLIWMWTFGHLVQDLIGNDKLIPIYLYSAIVASLSFILTSNLVFGEAAANMFFSGVVAGILGLAAAATTLVPRYRFFPMINGGIPLWIISLIYVLLNFSSAMSNRWSLIPMAFALLMGYAYIKQLQSGSDWGEWMNQVARWVNNLFSPDRRKSFNPRQASFYKQGNQSPFVKKANVTQQKIDEILDKINQTGYDSLSSEEKRILKEASKKI